MKTSKQTCCIAVLLVTNLVAQSSILSGKFPYTAVGFNSVDAIKDTGGEISDEGTSHVPTEQHQATNQSHTARRASQAFQATKYAAHAIIRKLPTIKILPKTKKLVALSLITTLPRMLGINEAAQWYSAPKPMTQEQVKEALVAQNTPPELEPLADNQLTGGQPSQKKQEIQPESIMLAKSCSSQECTAYNVPLVIRPRAPISKKATLGMATAMIAGIAATAAAPYYWPQIKKRWLGFQKKYLNFSKKII